MIRYAISDRRQFAGDDRARQEQVVRQAVTLALEGVDFFQLREKDLDDAALLALACRVRDAIRCTGAPMRVVLNGPPHLTASAGVGWHRSASSALDDVGEAPCLSCSVHTLDDVERERTRSSLLLFAPVFGKNVAGELVQPGVGLRHLRAAVECAAGVPVLALGGVTLHNAALCMQAGAAGVAGIRLFAR